MPSTPSDAGAIVLLRGGDSDLEVFWAERAAGSAFLAGYQAFIGGKVEPGDHEVKTQGDLVSGQPAATIQRLPAVAAVRELFEETGVLVAAGAPPAAALAAARRELAAARPFAEVLAGLGAAVDLGRLRAAGRWVTPAFAPRRFDTHFFLARLPEGQEPALTPGGELARGGFIRPRAALALWERAEVMVPPPVLHILGALARGLGPDLEARLLATPGAGGREVERMEFLPGIVLVPLKTETLPPATTTNAYVIGRERAVVVDPAASDPGEQEKLAAVVGQIEGEGVRIEAILLTHHHPDHVGGVEDLRRRTGAPVWAHAATRDALADRIGVDRVLADGERLDLGGGYAVTVLHTPGHTTGHLCFREERTGALLTGDNVVGHGTVLIDPPEGDMDLYLRSLRRLEAVGARALFGGHGPVLAHPGPAIRALLAHRLWREAEVVRALEAGARTVAEVADRAYPDAVPPARRLAARQTLAHLERLERAGQVWREGEEFRLYPRP